MTSAPRMLQLMIKVDVFTAKVAIICYDATTQSKSKTVTHIARSHHNVFHRRLMNICWIQRRMHVYPFICHNTTIERSQLVAGDAAVGSGRCVIV